MIHFTSDQHFDHENIIRYTDRPFHTVEEMNETLIDNWNKVVKPTDIVYDLGDFTLGKDAAKFLNRLNGYIRFVIPPFHHDKQWWGNRPLTNRIEYLPPMTVEKIGNVFIHMCHYPILVWDRKHYGAWHLYGHVHKRVDYMTGFSYNVGVDLNNYTPISFERLMDHMLYRGWSTDWREFNA